jgi:hypothetical protein
MSRAGFDADNVRLAPNIGSLKRGSIFETVPRHDPVVGIRRRHQHGGIVHARADVVIGRIRAQRPPVGLDRRTAIIIDPIAPRRKLVEAEHIHHPHRRKRGREEIGPLVDDRADEQPAVRSALDRQLIRRRYPLGNQIFARRNKVIEDILLARQPSGIVPVLAIFAAAAKVGDRQHAALFEPRQPRRRKSRSQ